MKRLPIFLVLFLAVLLVFGDLAFAQNQPEGERRSGTSAASELLIPVSSRYIATGGANVATVSDVESMYWNPAGLALAERSANGMFEHTTYLAEMDVNYIAVSSRFGGFGSIGVSFKQLAIGDIAITTEDSPDGTGGIISPQFLVFGLTYSRALSNRISVGATANLISETIDRASASGVAFDFGVQYRDLVGVNGLSFGVTLKSIGPSMQYGGTALLYEAQPSDVTRGPSPVRIETGKDELPSSLAIGLGYNWALSENNSVELVGSYTDNNFDDDHTRLGAQYNFNNLVFLRGGYNFAFNAGKEGATASGKDRFIYGLALGAGVHTNVGGLAIDLDYAFRQVEFFDNNNVFSVKLGF